MTFYLCMCVCVCVHMHAHADGDQFSGDTHGLGRVRSIQDLDRQASWVGHRPTLDPRRVCQVVRACQACKREVAEGWPRQVDLSGYLEASRKPGGEGSGYNLAQPGRQSGGLALGSLEGSTRGFQSLGASLSGCLISRCTCQLDSSTCYGPLIFFCLSFSVYIINSLLP